VIKNVNPTDPGVVLRQAASRTVFRANQTRRWPGDSVAKEEAPEVALTDRERTILEAVAAGKPTAEISKELWGSEPTVTFHLTNVYRKLGIPNRAGAVRLRARKR
jgi:two-component system response regulator DesR